MEVSSAWEPGAKERVEAAWLIGKIIKAIKAIKEKKQSGLEKTFPQLVKELSENMARLDEELKDNFSQLRKEAKKHK